ncbi:DUF2190 family protein [Patescibacteria group bacterium]|nr:DUF2190 family protein [Patescibacteria group bacterium]
MADETTLVFEMSKPVPFTCADGTGIEKGAVLEISDPFTVAVTNGDGDPIAGIAAEEKIANDGKVKIGVYVDGIFRGTAGLAGVTAGQGLETDTATGSANELVVIAAGEDDCVGMALETATDRETFLFRLNPYSRDIA